MNSSAYLLVSHGSRDPRPQTAALHLAQLVLARLQHINTQNQAERSPRLRDSSHQTTSTGGLTVLAASEPAIAPPPFVETAVLELHPQPFHQQLVDCAERAIAAGHRHLTVIPLFLLPGVHVMEDIPTEVAIAQRLLGSQITVQISPHLGSHPNWKTLLMSAWNCPATVSPILVSHGSRRPGGNDPVEAIATELGATTAYWSVLPHLDSQVARLVQMGCQEIAILPYFLFVGGIWDAIAQLVPQFTQQYPYVRFHLADPIGVSDALADAVLNLSRL
ncbi:MAG TPA: sirohydrochlorin chelatase [Crinalium sp.]